LTTQNHKWKNKLQTVLDDKLKENKMVQAMDGIVSSQKNKGVVSNGITASYYELPPDAKEIQDLISFKNMNSQMGEIGRTWYRYGESSHSDRLREINKILFYAEAERDRILKYGDI